MARETFLSTNEDRKWLREVHKIDIKKPQVAIMYGNEDWPEKIRVYESNHIDSPWVEWCDDMTGKMVRSITHPGIPATK